jgi:hypothetical protein
MSQISPQQKKDPQKKKKKKGARIEKKGGETSVEKLHVLRREEDEIYKLLGEIRSKERKKGDHNFL